MKDFHADRTALWTIMLAVCLAASGLIALAGASLDRWPNVMWGTIIVVGVIAAIPAFCILPLYFRMLSCTVSSSGITVTAGSLFRRAQSVRFERVQFVQILSGPFDGALGLNFVVLHMYGGHLTVPFLNRDDREALAALLQQKGVYHAP